MSKCNPHEDHRLCENCMPREGHRIPNPSEDLNYIINNPQPAPVANTSTPIWELVLSDMKERNRIGTEKYGTPLQAFNSRNSLQDAYEEVLDLAVYLRQVLEEKNLLEAIKSYE